MHRHTQQSRLDNVSVLCCQHTTQTSLSLSFIDITYQNAMRNCIHMKSYIWRMRISRFIVFCLVFLIHFIVCWSCWSNRFFLLVFILDYSESYTVHTHSIKKSFETLYIQYVHTHRVSIKRHLEAFPPISCFLSCPFIKLNCK